MYIRRITEFGKKAFIGESKVEYLYNNPLYTYEVDKLKDVHAMDDFFSNSYCLRRFLIKDLFWLHRWETGKDLGPSLTKDASVIVGFSKSESLLTLVGIKTYSRRSENKQRTYPVEWIAKRLEWFFTESPFVESFKVVKSGLHYTYRIKFVSCYSESRINMIRKRSALSERTRLDHLINKLEFAIENHDTIENLQKRLATAKELRDNKDREFHEIKI